MKNQNGSMAFTVQPCHTFGAPQVEYLVNSAFPSGNFLTLWQITNLTAHTPTLTRKQVTVSPYTLAPNADQSGGAPPLIRATSVYSTRCSAGTSVWTAFTTAHNWGGARTAQRYSGAKSVRPSRPWSSKASMARARSHYFFPACCPDNNGN